LGQSGKKKMNLNEQFISILKFLKQQLKEVFESDSRENYDFYTTLGKQPHIHPTSLTPQRIRRRKRKKKAKI
jgi:hypothetical protein